MPILSLFFLVLLCVFSVILFFTEPSKMDKLVQERLAALAKQGPVPEGDEDEGLLKEATFSKIHWLDNYLRHNLYAIRLQLMLAEADLNWTVGRFFLLTLVAVVVGVILGWYLLQDPLAAWVPGVFMSIAPYWYVRNKRSARLRKFGSQLPEAVDLISRALRAGHSVLAAIELVAMEIGDPLGPEFRRAYDEQKFGLPFREAMINLGRRIPLADLQFLITAMLVQKETGGNLAEVLDKTSAVVRERLRLAGQLRIHTAQGRLTAWILCSMPIGCFFVMSFLNPGYTHILMEDEVGRRMLAAGLAGLVVGVLTIRSIVNVKV